MSHPFASDPSVDFTITLWEDFDAIRNRAATALKTFEDLAFRCKKNSMAHDAFSKEIKSRKFQLLSEDGSIGMAWNGFKDVTSHVEKLYTDLSQTDANLEQKITQESQQYKQAAERIERQLRDAKAKIQKVQADTKVKQDRYTADFHKWDDAARSNRSDASKLAKTKDASEQAYRKAVAECQAAENEYFSQAKDLLGQFETLENDRLTNMKSYLDALYGGWKNAVQETLQLMDKAVQAIEYIDIAKDLRTFVEASGSHNPPPALTELQLLDSGSSGGGSIPAAPAVGSIPAAPPVGSVPAAPPLGGGGVPAAPPVSRSGGGGSDGFNPKKRQVLYDYVAEDGSFSLSVGEEVTVTQEDQGGWIICRTSSGAEGYAPTNYVESVADARARHGSGGGAAAAAVDLSSTMSKTHKEKKKKRLMTYEYTAEDGSIYVAAGETVTILQEDENGWTMCKTSTGVEGYVPSNFLGEEVKKDKKNKQKAAAHSEPPPPEDDDLPPPPPDDDIPAAPPMGMSPMNELSAALAAKRNRSAASPAASPVSSTVSSPRRDTPAASRAGAGAGGASGGKKKVLFDLSSSDPDLVRVTKGEIVEVLDEDPMTCWMTVKTSKGKTGLVPTNYLSEQNVSGAGAGSSMGSTVSSTASPRVGATSSPATRSVGSPAQSSVSSPNSGAKSGSRIAALQAQMGVGGSGSGGGWRSGGGGGGGMSATMGPRAGAGAGATAKSGGIKKKVAFDFSATDSSQLSVTKGDVVEVVDEDANSGWSTVRNMQGKEGYVPSNYLGEEVKGGAGAMSSTMGARGGRGMGAPKPARKKAKVLYDCAAENEGMLSVRANEMVELEGAPADGWIMAINSRGERGYVAENYLKVMP